MEYVKLDRHVEALNEFETVIKNDSDYVATYYQMAKAYEHEGRTDDAKRAYRSGMDAASRAGDIKTRDELSEALNMLLGS